LLDPVSQHAEVLVILAPFAHRLPVLAGGDVGLGEINGGKSSIHILAHGDVIEELVELGYLLDIETVLI
jgi:hypothetical protein